MRTTNEALLEHFFAGEMLHQRTHRTVSRICLSVMVLLFVAWLVGVVNTLTNVVATALGCGLILALSARSKRLARSLHERLGAFLIHIDVDWDDIASLRLPSEHTEAVFQAYTANFEKVGHTNKKQLRIRGGDEKGPAFGEAQASFEPSSERQDPSIHAGDYEELEGPLLGGEVLLEEANQAYADLAQERWEQAEREDLDLIEAGVDSLGDLVASGWFEKNAEDGAVRTLMESKDDAS